MRTLIRNFIHPKYNTAGLQTLHGPAKYGYYSNKGSCSSKMDWGGLRIIEYNFYKGNLLTFSDRWQNSFTQLTFAILSLESDLGFLMGFSFYLSLFEFDIETTP